MTSTFTTGAPEYSPRVWFGWMGGALAWLVHLLAAYAISEFGCVAGLGESSLLGLSAVAWMVIGVSIVLTLVAAAATGVAYRAERAIRAHDLQASTRGFLARAGVITSGLFVFIILSESVPIFFFLKDC